MAWDKDKPASGDKKSDWPAAATANYAILDTWLKEIGNFPTSTATLTLTTDLSLNDSVKLTLGTGGDADLYYDGTDVVLDTSVVGSGDFYVKGGRVETDDSEGVVFGTGKDASILYDGTDLVYQAALVGSGQHKIVTTDARTSTVDIALLLESLSTGTEVAGIGTGIQFNASTPSEDPMILGSVDFSAIDVTNASEDTEFNIQLRVGGSAIEDKYTFQSTAGSGFVGIFTHAVSADRTWTLPDASGTISVAKDISVKVYGSGAQTIANTTWTLLTFDTEAYDTDGMHSTVSNTNRLKAITAGKYHITGRVKWVGDTTGTRSVALRLNETTQIDYAFENNPDTGAEYMSVSTDYDLSVNDYVGLRVYQSSGGNLDVSNAIGSTHFEMHKFN